MAADELLAGVADVAGDSETAGVARRIGAEERGMADRLSACFRPAVDASLVAVDPGELTSALVSYLADAHATGSQSAGLLRRAPGMSGDAGLTVAYQEHLDETDRAFPDRA